MKIHGPFPLEEMRRKEEWTRESSRSNIADLLPEGRVGKFIIEQVTGDFQNDTTLGIPNEHIEGQTVQFTGTFDKPQPGTEIRFFRYVNFNAEGDIKFRFSHEEFLALRAESRKAIYDAMGIPEELRQIWEGS